MYSDFLKTARVRLRGVHKERRCLAGRQRVDSEILKLENEGF